MDTGLACESFRYDNDERWFEMMLKCTELVSVNSAHQMNLKQGRVFDAPWTTRFKNELKDQLTLADPRKYCKWLDNGNIFFLAVKYVLKQYYWSRDLDNLHKYTQDCIADACYLNDSRIVEVHIWKDFRPGDYEYMIVKLGVSSYNYNEFR